jgi:hypothetical protein
MKGSRSMQQITTIGLDLAKQVFQVHGAEADGSPVVSRKLRRGDVLPFFKKLSPCMVGMEACGGAYYWAREIAKFGHDVRLVPPSYVKPFVKRGKTDAADAEAICEAVIRKTMRFVPIKSADQQAAAMVLKTRELLVRQRTQAIATYTAWILVSLWRCANNTKDKRWATLARFLTVAWAGNTILVLTFLQFSLLIKYLQH